MTRSKLWFLQVQSEAGEDGNPRECELVWEVTGTITEWFSNWKREGEGKITWKKKHLFEE